MIWTLSILQDPQPILDQFHSFHDGFIHKLCLRSKDKALKGGNQTVTGEFDVKLTIANVEFLADPAVTPKTVRISFISVRSISFHSGVMEGYEWPISKFFLTPASRKNCYHPSQEAQACFELKVLSDKYNKTTNSWESGCHELLSFSFTEAELDSAL